MQTNFKNRYKVEYKIGEGSFSEVLKCLDKTTGKAVAAKLLKKQFKSANHASDIAEVVALQKISCHPNILEMLELFYDTENGKVTLVFELMDMSLYDLMKNRKRPISEGRAQNYLYQIVKGVYHLHFHGVFHRDIKPENILIKDENLKISDLGSIKGLYSTKPYTEYISTRWYRSPECLLTKGYYGPKMDIWAIGCVFYELLTLRPLFPGSNELDQISRIDSVLGSPSIKLINKFKKHAPRNMLPEMTVRKGTGLDALLPSITANGREALKQMVQYDPDLRINIRRLLDHKYFTSISGENSEKVRTFKASASLPTAFGNASTKSLVKQSSNYQSLMQTNKSKIQLPPRPIIAVKNKPMGRTHSNLEKCKQSFQSSCYSLTNAGNQASSNSLLNVNRENGASTRSFYNIVKIENPKGQKSINAYQTFKYKQILPQKDRKREQLAEVDDLFKQYDLGRKPSFRTTTNMKLPQRIVITRKV